MHQALQISASSQSWRYGVYAEIAAQPDKQGAPTVLMLCAVSATIPDGIPVWLPGAAFGFVSSIGL